MRRVIGGIVTVFGVLVLIVAAVVLWSVKKPRIYYTIRNGDTNALKRFINDGGDVNQRIKLDKSAPSLLGIAVGRGQVHIVELLLKNKADPNFIVGGFDCDPLVLVVDAHQVRGSDDSYPQVMKLLLAYGANPNLTDQWGNHCPALYDAAEFGDREMIKLLLAAGADVNATNYFGETPLHRVKNVECAKLLVAVGAKCKVTAHGETPADTALGDKRTNVYEFLLKECKRLP